MKQRSVSLTDEEDRFFCEYAKRKGGWSIQTFIKTALYHYADRYPRKDVIPMVGHEQGAALTQQGSEGNPGDDSD
jgi:hypothetical protein